VESERKCVGHVDELGGERPLWGLRKATTSWRQLHVLRGRVGRKPETKWIPERKWSLV